MRLMIACLLLLSFPALAAETQGPAPHPAEPPSAIAMEWNFTQPSKEIAALSDECDKRFPGLSHTCEIISRAKRDSHKALLRSAPAADVILGSDFGRRGRIVCRMGVPHSVLRSPKTFPWLTLAQMQDFFESEKLAAKPWSCAIRKCDEGDCRTLGDAKLLSASHP
jgi:hypothetical protein